MTRDTDKPTIPDAAREEDGQSPPIPRPPSREGLEQISRQQELLGDDWTGDGPGLEEGRRKPGAADGGGQAG